MRLTIVTKTDVEAILDIKDDVRTECSKIGEVTNVVLYDLEPAGVVTVRFAQPEDAQTCVEVCSFFPFLEIFPISPFSKAICASLRFLFSLIGLNPVSCLLMLILSPAHGWSILRRHPD